MVEVSQQTRLKLEDGRANQKLFGQIFKQMGRDIHPDPKVSKRSPKDPALYTKRQEQLLLEQPDRAIKTAVATVLGQSCASSTTEERVIGADAWTDSGQDKSTSLHHMDRTSSELGRMCLMGLVGCPAKDVEVLRSRQPLLRTLAQHEENNPSLGSQSDRKVVVAAIGPGPMSLTRDLPESKDDDDLVRMAVAGNKAAIY